MVDDVPANVKLLEARLSAEYFDVLTASNGMEALKICERAECDIILLDVMMPDMDGFEVARRIRESDGFAQLPVVMVTALSGKEDRLHAVEAGANDFLTKPIEKGGLNLPRDNASLVTLGLLVIVLMLSMWKQRSKMVAQPA